MNSFAQSLHGAVAALGRERGLEVNEQPAILVRSLAKERAVSLEDTHESASGVSPQRAEEGIEPLALYVGPYSVLIGDLTAAQTSQEADDAIGRYHYEAAVKITELPQARRADLNLFLVFPSIASQCVEWEILARRVERDDRICRKLVWLPPAEQSGASRSLNAFLQRTFLARPWASHDQIANRGLAPLRRILESSPALRLWRPILLERGEGDFITADELVDLWAQRAEGLGNVP